MTTKELREAAILLHDWFAKNSECIEHDWNKLDDHDYVEEKTKAVLMLSRHILANVQEDGEDVVDAIWLEREYRFKQYEDFWYIHTNTCEMKYYYDGIYAGHQKLIHKPTRSQFRALMVGLNIERNPA